MEDFEKLGLFYLGRKYDLENKEILPQPLLYKSKDLTTHAVCIGMTGSGKTGLCVGLLEEAAIDGIPSIIIDPKGDLCNLMLTFPNLSGEEFLPWINKQEAENQGITEQEFAQDQAELWKKGISLWGQDSNRIRRLKQSAEFNIYTPGSSAGIPVSILKSFSCPSEKILSDRDLLNESINSTVTSLLSLLDIKADPIQSREHILLSNIFKSVWSDNKHLDLESLIKFIQKPPLEKIGVMNLESFYPSEKRSELALTINNLLAAPGFSTWLEGEPLDIDRFLFTSQGKPKVSIFSISHLNDSQRMITVSLLLTQLVSWMRNQSGTSSLRAIFYMDEIFSYFPPVANPPSKTPLLTLLKQSRAYGLGVVLTTQNPVDLDYKGLSNTGTWFIGRLQTEQDQDRIIEGLKATENVVNQKLNLAKLKNILGQLNKRVFLINNVHQDFSETFHTRWVLSYLRGPLTRTQIKSLVPEKSSAVQPLPAESKIKTTLELSSTDTIKSSIPILPPHIEPRFLPVQNKIPENSNLLYQLMVWGKGTIYYLDAKKGISTEQPVDLLCSLTEENPKPDWETAQEVSFEIDDLFLEPDPELAVYHDPPAYLNDKNIVKQWQKYLINWLYRNQQLELLKSPSLGIISQPDEDEREFRIRLQTAAHEKRDEMVEKLTEKYQKKINSLENKIFKAEQKLDKEKEQQKHQQLQTSISLGATVLSALVGRNVVSRSTLGRATTSARGAGRVLKEQQDVKLAEENLKRLQQELEQLNKQMAEDIKQIKESINPAEEQLENFELKPKKKNISIDHLMLVWIPFLNNQAGQNIQPAFNN